MKVENDLLLRIIDGVHKLGVSGEEDSIIVLTIKIMLRLVKNGNPVSGNVLVSDKSGIGKDFVSSKVCELLVPIDRFKHLTHITEKVFAYYRGSWNEVVVLLGDVDASLLNSCVFKTMASGGKETYVVNNRSVDKIMIKGKPVIILTSYSAYLDDETKRRWDILSLDDSVELTDLILSDADKVRCCDERLKKYLCNLRSFEVVVPFASEVLKDLPVVLDARTFKDKLIDFTKASCVLYQEFRKRDKKGRLVAEYFDFEVARFCFNRLKCLSVLSLNSREKELLELIPFGKGMLMRELISKSRFSKSLCYTIKDSLKSKGLVKEFYEFDTLSNKEVIFVSRRNVDFEMVLRKFDGEFDKILDIINESRRNNGLGSI